MHIVWSCKLKLYFSVPLSQNHHYLMQKKRSTNPISVSQKRQRLPRGQRKNTCSKCDKPIEESRKGQRYCKSCHAENMRKNRPKHSELTEEQRKKANARSYVNKYQGDGKVIKMPCEICGSDKTEKHHDNYDKPLEVKWLCRKHHLEYHKSLLNG